MNMENSPNKTKRQKTSKGSKTTKNTYSVVEPKSRRVQSLSQNLKQKKQRCSINFQIAPSIAAPSYYDSLKNHNFTDSFARTHKKKQFY